MGGNRGNRNKWWRNPAVAPPLPAAPAASTSVGAAADQPEEADPAYELTEKQLLDDKAIVDHNIVLRETFKETRVFVQLLENKQSLITGEESKERYTVKWVKGAGSSLMWMIHHIESLEMQVRLMGGEPMPRPPEIHNFINLVKRII